MSPLQYHRLFPSGKFKTVPSKPMENAEHLALAYSPGVGDACMAIVDNPSAAQDLTMRSHLVAVISNGTAVLGFGNIGPLAAKPVMEGKAALFQKFAKLDAIDLEINEEDPQKLQDIIASLAPSIGGINLEDIKSPECFDLEKALIERLDIPVFHDDQHGTAITVAAAITNALSLVGKSLDTVRLVVLGAGAGAMACVSLLKTLGMKKDSIIVCDTKGVIYKGRPDLSVYKEEVACDTLLRSLQEALEGADIFLGLSGANLVSSSMIKAMAPSPLIFALANPVPEIWPHEVLSVRSDALVGTGRSDLPNQVNNVLCFPYIFRGALDSGCKKITTGMKIACVKALSSLAQKGFSDIKGAYSYENCEFTRSYFLPKPFDPRLLTDLPLAVAKAALEEGLTSDFCLETYKTTLQDLAYEDMPFLRTLLAQTSSIPPLLFYEGISEVLLNLSQALARYHLATPGFIGKEEQIRPLLSSYPLLCKAPILSSWEENCRGLRSLPAGSLPTLEAWKQEKKYHFFASSPLPLWCQKVLEKTGWKEETSLGTLTIGQPCPCMLNPIEGPFYMDSPQWQYYSSSDSVKSLVERASFLLLSE